ncbi:MAG: hypothetical protein Q8S33_10950 [Myxococcales bacterium]|nr:hypothetical protein [Myxococcales bacterium]
MRFASWMSVTSLTLCALGATSTLWRRVTVFPLEHPMWWATTGTVFAAWLVVALAVIGAMAKRPALTFTVALAPGVMLMSGGLAGRFWFELTDGTFFGAPFAVGVLWLLTTFRSYRELATRLRWTLVGVSLLFAPLGVVQLRARVPAPVGTTPALTELPPRGGPFVLPDGVTLSETASLQAPCGHGTVTLAPLLTFQDASDDGFWPMGHTPTTERATERPALDGPLRRASLQLEPLDGGALLLDTATLVPKQTASHLNRYTDVTIVGLVAPRLSFGPTGSTSFAVEPFDYPRGRPAQFGVLLSSGDFAILRATNAEKGPFRELARGPLARGAPLSVTLFDGDAPQCRVTWLDYSAQADVTLSPAAGEGVPVNVVQFGRPASDESKVVIMLSLAATGIGEGLDTVLHAKGVYRNRVLLEPLSRP